MVDPVEGARTQWRCGEAPELPEHGDLRRPRRSGGHMFHAYFPGPATRFRLTSRSTVAAARIGTPPIYAGAALER
jgi:hypothetical protein